MRKLVTVLAVIALSGCGASTATTSPPSSDPTTVSPVTTVADADVWRGELAGQCAVAYEGQDALDCICRAQLITGEMTRADYDLAFRNKWSTAADLLDDIYRRCYNSQ